MLATSGRSTGCGGIFLEVKMIKRTLSASIFALSALTGGASQAAVYDLAFIMDESGSVGSGNYTAAMNSLASALSTSLTQAVLDVNQYNITVISFSANSDVVVNSTLVSNTTQLAGVTAAINTISYDGSTTNYADAFNTLANLANALTVGSAGSIINMMTDGEPNPNSGSNSDANILAAALNLRSLGWDSLSFEAVTSSPDTNFLKTLAFDTSGVGTNNVISDASLINDPLNETFVLKVQNFGSDYDSAIAAKVAKIVDPDPIDPVPVPAALPLLAGGLALFGFVGRRRRNAA